jgi:tetratricopeptide (TPR) repeat protein
MSDSSTSYFQGGVSNFLLGSYEVAIADFDEALLYLRGNQAMCVQALPIYLSRRLTLFHSNYEQLGLKFLLYSAEILFNKGLCLVYLSRTAEGLSVMEEARQEKATDEHNVIDDAIQDKGEGYTVFSIVRTLAVVVRRLLTALDSLLACCTAPARTKSRMPRPKTTWARLYVIINGCFIPSCD